MSMPTFEEVLEKLKELTEIDDLDPDAPVSELEIDSLDVLEWLYAVADDNNVEFDEEALADIEDVTIRKIYGRVIQPLLAEPTAV